MWMAAVPPPEPRRRPRPGSPERPVNARMYRGTWLLLSVPLLLGAFSVSRPTPMPEPFPPAFDTTSAVTLATELGRFYPERFPASDGAVAAAAWFREQLAPYGVRIRSQRFEAEVAGYGRIRFENLIATVRGRSDRRVVVMAHRDDVGLGPGADDNASGTAALIVLARSYATPASSEDIREGPAHTIVFLSTDGGALGGVGAAHFAATEGENVDAVVNLDAIAGKGTASLQFSGDRPRSPPGSLVRTASAQLLEQTGRAARRPSALRQLVDLAFPFSLYEHAPFVGRGIPAITLTRAGDAPRPAEADAPGLLQQPGGALRIGQIGRAAQMLVGSIDQGLETGRGGPPYLYLGPRLVRGWAVQLVLIAMVLPFLAAAVDLFARCRRRRIPLAPAVRSYRGRLGFWVFAGLVFAVLAALGAWQSGSALPIAPQTDAAGDWSLGAAVLLGAVSLGAWFVARHRLVRRRTVSVEEELAGHTAALLILGLIALLVIATNAFALIFLLPSLHAWIWLPQVRDRPIWIRLAVFAGGFAGPALLLWSFATRFGLGSDAPAYIVQLIAVGYVPFTMVLLSLGWLAVAGQLAALAAGRYAPYPKKGERPPLGPIRQVVRQLLLLVVSRRRTPAIDSRALGG
jgi:peptidase M28-like protein